MKKYSLTFLFVLLASPAWATTYFLAPASGGGNDSNNGTSSGSPWLSPNHSVNCGDVIIAAVGTYSAANFYNNKWGTVTCAAGDNVAWLTCATFDACKINASSTYGMWISKSYWGVQGWEIHATGSYAGCFEIAAANSGASTIHHIILANDIANGCTASGFSSINEGNAGVDYLVIVGDIAYNSTSDPTECYSGINIGVPIASDSLPGTHIYVAGNFSWGNTDPNPCAGTAPTDGEGIIFDTFNGKNYNQQAVAENNLLFLNGGRGLQANQSSNPIYFVSNTIYGNNNDPNQPQAMCAELVFNNSIPAQAYNNLIMTNAATGCKGNTKYAVYIGSGSTSNTVRDTVAFSASGTPTRATGSGSFAFGPNLITSINPGFANTSDPGAPNCGSSSSVPNCMATVIAGFKPTNSAAMAYGYHIPLTTNVTNPLFPQWLCNVNLPPGLVTRGCVSSSSQPAPVTITNVVVK
jgi:hypothetical protein